MVQPVYMDPTQCCLNAHWTDVIRNISPHWKCCKMDGSTSEFKVRRLTHKPSSHMHRPDPYVQQYCAFKTWIAFSVGLSSVEISQMYTYKINFTSKCYVQKVRLIYLFFNMFCPLFIVEAREL